MICNLTLRFKTILINEVDLMAPERTSTTIKLKFFFSSLCFINKLFEIINKFNI